MSDFKDKDVKEIIQLLSEISTNDLIYMPNKTTQKQKDDAKKIYTSHGGGDDGQEELAQQTFDKLKNAKSSVESKLGQFKRIKGQESKSSKLSPNTPTGKFNNSQGTNPFSIDFNSVNPNDFDANADGTTDRTVSNSADCKFIIKSYSNNGVRCEGKSGDCNGKEWLITFTNKVQNNQNNTGQISLFDGTTAVRSNPSTWSGKMMNIKS
jgi:hypothetical protein